MMIGRGLVCAHQPRLAHPFDARGAHGLVALLVYPGVTLDILIRRMQRIMRRSKREVGKKGFAIRLVPVDVLDDLVCVIPGGVKIGGQFNLPAVFHVGHRRQFQQRG